MIWLWLHSLVLLVATFAVGLWLGRALSAATSGRTVSAPHSNSFVLNEEGELYPPYHGAEVEDEPVPVVAEPVTRVELEPAPPPPPPPPPPVTSPVRAAMLFPINQFGVITVTQAPAT